MAGKKAVDGVEDAVPHFPRGSAKAIERLIRRAQDKAVHAARRGISTAAQSGTKGGRLGSEIGRSLGRELAKAMSQRDVPKREAASIRQKAPDSGGRPFHFAHSVVTKADSAAAAASGRAAKAGSAAVHMRYIERETAVEVAARRPEVDDRAESAEVACRTAMTGRNSDDGSLISERRGAPGMGEALTSAAAAQGYVENPVKLANGENVVLSFGTIGNTFEERVNYWTALEAAEAHPSARVQDRLIVELPHEARPEARYEIVREFCKRFEADGIPYWAALHAPGKDNDSRNFHAHIVYSERPAKRMIDPLDGREKWDFEVVRTYVKASRHRVQTRPERQNKLRAYTNRRFIPDLRRTFAEISNGVLTREDVRDAEGAPVRYDHRSYKDMGVDAVPMRSIERIVADKLADKLKDGHVTVLDGDYTRKMIAAEIRRAAAQRDKRVLALIALDKALEVVIREPSKARFANRRLPCEMRISPLAQLSKSTLRAASKRLMAAHRAALKLDVMERSTAASLTQVMEATSSKAVAAAARSQDPLVRAAAPDPEMAALLHDAAEEEMAAMQADAAETRRMLGLKTASALMAWKEVVGPFRSAPSATMRRAIDTANAPPEVGRSGASAATLTTDAVKAQGQVTSSRDDVSTRGTAPARDAAGGAHETGDELGQVPGGTRAPGTASGAGVEKADGTTIETEKDSEVMVKAGGAGPSARGETPSPGGKSIQRDLEGLASIERAPAHKALEAEIDMAAMMHVARLFEHVRDGGAAQRQRLAKAGPKQGRAPTPVEATAASRGISAFLKAVKEATDDVEQRLQIFASFVRPHAALPASHDSEDAVTISGPAAASQASEPDASASLALPQGQRTTAEVNQAAEDNAGRPDTRLDQDRMRLNDPARRRELPPEQMAARESGATSGARVEVPEPIQDGGPASSEADDRAPRLQHRAASKPFTMRVDEPVEMIALGAGAGTPVGRSADPASIDSAGIGRAAVAAESPPAKPPQRRKSPEDVEEERRKKKRRAVLAKRKIRNRGRER